LENIKIASIGVLVEAQTRRLLSLSGKGRRCSLTPDAYMSKTHTRGGPTK
jgi:hypothetical protein